MNTAVGRISALASRGSHVAFCASVPPPRISSAAISDRVPSEPTPIYPRLSSSLTTHIAVFDSPDPPYSSGMVSPNTPSAPISSTISIGISSSSRCQPCANGTTRSSANRRNWSRIISYSSSSPVAPNVAAPCPATISSTSRARAASVLPPSISASTAGTRNAATTSSPSPRSRGRTISFCDIGMPPASCPRYSPQPICRISRSISPKPPAASSRAPQPAISRNASA